VVDTPWGKTDVAAEYHLRQEAAAKAIEVNTHLRMMAEALQFYADPANWYETDEGGQAIKAAYGHACAHAALIACGYLRDEEGEVVPHYPEKEEHEPQTGDE